MKRTFIDHVVIQVQAGKGGDGCSSFYRDLWSRFSKPDGGYGGKGGDVVITADRNTLTLIDLGYRKHFVAQKGKNGQGNDKTGEEGKNCIIKIPPGSIIKDAVSGLILRDLTKAGEEVIVARGGRGGLGNRPRREATKGEAGEEKKLYIELKLVADVSIIGYPNVGKSTFLNRITSAKSKVAAYPFTTKVPILGSATIGNKEKIFTVCDIPGLIEGAHKGKGLGHDFLRHIERTRLLIHMVDMSSLEGRDAYKDYINLNNELILYNPKLGEKIQILVANKMDIPGAEENIKKFRRNFKGKIYPVSAFSGKGIEQLLAAIGKALN